MKVRVSVWIYAGGMLQCSRLIVVEGKKERILADELEKERWRNPRRNGGLLLLQKGTP